MTQPSHQSCQYKLNLSYHIISQSKDTPHTHQHGTELLRPYWWHNHLYPLPIRTQTTPYHIYSSIIIYTPYISTRDRAVAFITDDTTISLPCRFVLKLTNILSVPSSSTPHAYQHRIITAASIVNDTTITLLCQFTLVPIRSITSCPPSTSPHTSHIGMESEQPRPFYWWHNYPNLHANTRILLHIHYIPSLYHPRTFNTKSKQPRPLFVDGENFCAVSIL